MVLYQPHWCCRGLPCRWFQVWLKYSQLFTPDQNLCCVSKRGKYKLIQTDTHSVCIYLTTMSKLITTLLPLLLLLLQHGNTTFNSYFLPFLICHGASFARFVSCHDEISLNILFTVDTFYGPVSHTSATSPVTTCDWFTFSPCVNKHIHPFHLRAQMCFSIQSYIMPLFHYRVTHHNSFIWYCVVAFPLQKVHPQCSWI